MAYSPVEGRKMCSVPLPVWYTTRWCRDQRGIRRGRGWRQGRISKQERHVVQSDAYVSKSTLLLDELHGFSTQFYQDACMRPALLIHQADMIFKHFL